MDINQKYQEILSRCKFISKPDTWFVEGGEAKVQGGSYHNYTEGDKFNSGWSLFRGLTNEDPLESYDGYTGELPRLDGETCPFDEFLIYDEWGNEISELTLGEYLPKIRIEKIDNLYDRII